MWLPILSLAQLKKSTTAVGIFYKLIKLYILLSFQIIQDIIDNIEKYLI